MAEVKTINAPEVDYANNQARLLGLLATLALPLLQDEDGAREVRRIVEVKLEGKWYVVSEATVLEGRLVLSHGRNGSRWCRELDANRAPPWRCDQPVGRAPGGVG